MVRFEIIMGGFRVLVGHNEDLFGLIFKKEGFIVAPTTIQSYTTVSADDLREIARKVDEVQRGGL